jgi:DNA-binding transcriptional ArsR family regulator
MIQIRLNLRDLARIRFGYSPLFECVAGARALSSPSRHAIHLPWARAVGVMRDAAPLGETLAKLVRTPTGYFPDFLAPPPAIGLPSFESEIKGLVTTPATVVRRELLAAFQRPSAIPSPFESLYTSPAEGLQLLAGMLTDYWRRAIEPVWPRVRAILEAEMLYRARALAIDGPEQLFHGLHPAVTYRSGCVDVEVDVRRALVPRGRGLLLMPSVFTWPDVFVTKELRWRPTLTYPARGVADLWFHHRQVSAVSAAVLMLGRQRALMMRRLRTPVTTTELAQQLRLTKSAVSQQLSLLLRANIVSRTRVARHVFYTLNERGRALDGVFAGRPH